MNKLLLFTSVLCGIFALNCGTEEASQTVAEPPTFCERKFQDELDAFGISFASSVKAVDIVSSACYDLGGIGDRDAVVDQIVTTSLKTESTASLWLILDNCPASYSVDPTWTLKEAVANCLIERALESTEAVKQHWEQVQYLEQLCNEDPRSVGCLEIKRYCRNLNQSSTDPFKPKTIDIDPLCTQLERKGVIRR